MGFFYFSATPVIAVAAMEAGVTVTAAGELLELASNIKETYDNNAAQPKYDYGKYGSNFMNHEAQIRIDLGIPDTWDSKKTDDPGIKSFDPNNPRQNHVRASPGVPSVKHPTSQVPNVKWYMKGAPRTINGDRINTLDGQNQTGHQKVIYLCLNLDLNQ